MILALAVVTADMRTKDHVDDLGIAKSPGQVSLAGAPKKLHTLTTMGVVGNPKLSQAAVEAFTAQLDMNPQNAYFGGWDERACFQVMPW